MQGGKTAALAKPRIETRAEWLDEIDALLDDLEYGTVVVSVYRSQVTGVSVAREIIREPRGPGRSRQRPITAR
jgi:hypothetical protein